MVLCSQPPTYTLLSKVTKLLPEFLEVIFGTSVVCYLSVTELKNILNESFLE